MAALFFDIDGTLLDFDHHLSGSTKRALLAAKANGHQIYINSGRTRVYINHEEMLSVGFDGIVCGCGTQVEMNGETVFYHGIEQEVLERILPAMEELAIPAILEGRYYLFMDEDMICTDAYGRRLFKTMAAHIQPIRNNEANWEGSKLSAVIYDRDWQKLMEMFEKEFYFAVHQGKAMEIIPHGCTKATGIAEVCELTGVAQADTFAFGDGVNDIEMLEYAGCGIVMGSGRDQAKEVADFITKDIREDGIEYALKHFDLI